MKERVLLCLNHMGGKELEYVKEAFEGNWVVPLGPHVDRFEEALTRFCNNPDRVVVALSAGTAAIHLALKTLGVGRGDEVIVQDMTFCASCNPVEYLGATPVFVDSEPETWNMNPALLEQAILERKKATGSYPKAIIPVWLYGMPPKMSEIMEVAERYGIPVVEDSAEGFGSVYKGRIAGTIGRMGILSFNGNKMITTSGGGALICSPEDRKRVMYFATQAREPYPWYQHTEIGYNYRLSNISAAIGLGQMEILDEHLAHHRMLHRLYTELFAGSRVEVHQNPGADFDSNFWLVTVLLPGCEEGEKGEPSEKVKRVQKALAEEGIETRPLWKPMHMQPVYSDAPAFVNGVGESLFRRGLCLPSGPYVTEQHARRIAALILDMQ